jgi:cobalt-zinc-cadmium efflux system membrane fusion protein
MNNNSNDFQEYPVVETDVEPDTEPSLAQPSRSRRLRPLWIALALAALALIAFVALRRATPNATEPVAEENVAADGGEAGDETAQVQTVQFDDQSARLAGLVVKPATLTQLATGVPFNGQIAANPNGVARVASLVPGRVTRLNVSQGDRVTQGQVLAIVESRAIGEAQSAYGQAVARFNNAKSNLSVVEKQARAGVFSKAPVEAARRAQVEAAGDVRESETAVRQARATLENVERQARAGAFASPALEAAKSQQAAAKQEVTAAEAALDESEDAVRAARAELERREKLASAGAYGSRPVEEARRVLSAAQASLSAARSEVATTRLNLKRAQTLATDGLISQREVEAANLAYEQAQSRLETAQSEVAAGQQEYSRQQSLATSNVAQSAEVSAAQSQLAGAEAAMKTRRAEVQRAAAGQELAQVALSRERAIFGQNIANRREVTAARSALEQAENALVKARQQKAVAETQLARERRIAGQNINNIAQLQAAQAGYRGAQADLKAARSALSLLKSSPNGTASVPIRAPISGVVQSRDVSSGETIEADKQLMSLVNLDKVAVEAAIYEKDFARVRIGAPVTATVDAFPGRTFSGRITFLGSQLDPETRTLTARALLDNNGSLRPGMFARGQIAAQTGKLGVGVPADAVQTMEDKTVVFVATDKANEFETRPVKTGASAKGVTEIKSGLKPGEKIVTKGAFVVKSQAMKSELAEE